MTPEQAFEQIMEAFEVVAGGRPRMAHQERIRACLEALSDPEEAIEAALQDRRPVGV